MFPVKVIQVLPSLDEVALIAIHGVNPEKRVGYLELTIGRSRNGHDFFVKPEAAGEYLTLGPLKGGNSVQSV